MSYATFKKSVLGKKIFDGECVSLIVNNSKAYCESLWPGVSWPTIIKPDPSAKNIFANASTKYFVKIINDHSNASQLPKQGDVMVFGATPQTGYSNTFRNPFGHVGVCDKANSSGYWLLQQNAPASGQAVNVTYYPWRFRPCIGWLRPISKPATTPKPIAKEIPSEPTKTTTPTPPKPIEPANPTPPKEVQPPKVIEPTPIPPISPTTGKETTPTKSPAPKKVTIKVAPTQELNIWQLIVAIIKKLLGVKEK